MTPAPDFHAAKAMLDWLAELGVEELVSEAPVNSYTRPDTLEPLPKGAAPKASASPTSGPDAAPVASAAPVAPTTDVAAEAEAAARAAADLPALAAAMEAFPHAAIRQGARNFVFSDGLAGAHVMIVGEAPGREEDEQGKPFVGRAGQLLDQMFAPIGLSRGAETPQDALYIANLLPWRPPQNREPTPDETAMFLPFLTRHIELAAPRVLVLMGNTPCGALLGRKGITKLRGQWAEAAGRPALPTFHPAYLLRTAAAKRDAWADLLSLKAHLLGRP